MSEIELLCNHLNVKQQLILAAMLEMNRQAIDAPMNSEAAMPYNVLGQAIFNHAMRDDSALVTVIAEECMKLAVKTV